MLQYIASVINTALSSPFRLFMTVVATLAFAVVMVANRKKVRLTDGDDPLDVLFGLVAGSVFGALSGVLWARVSFVQIAPGIHLRLFAFLPPVIGVLFGPGTGFVSGYVATIVWAQLSGLFIPLHTPVVDGIFVGLTGWLPAILLRGNRTNAELLSDVNDHPKRWIGKSLWVCAFTGIFMATFVALSLKATIDLPFITGLVMIGVISDSGPMLATGWLSKKMLEATRPMWNWLRTF